MRTLPSFFSMHLPDSDIAQARELLENAERFLCVCHRNPDGDAIGSLLGMGQLLGQVYPDKTAPFHCVAPAPAMFHFLPAAFRVEVLPDPLPPPAGTVFVFLDCAEPKLTE